jgi:hypothetical protein
MSPLRIYTHNPLTWYERCASFIRRAGFLPIARLITGGLPMMDSTALRALWLDHSDAAGRRHDPWSPHRWHSSLWAGVFSRVERLRRRSYRHSTPRCPCSLLTLTPVWRVLRTQSFRYMIDLVFGIWMTSHRFLIYFNFFVFRYARAWLWHMVVGFLFSDGSGNTIS